MKKFLFILDPLESLNLPMDSSLKLAAALGTCGAVLAYCTFKDLFWLGGSSAAANVTELRCRYVPHQNSEIQLGVQRLQQLDAFDVILMRKDPPFNLDYVVCTWFLDTVANKSLVINHPEALRNLNEKLSIFKFNPGMEKGLVSLSASQIYAYIREECAGDAIVKPLLEFGGRQVTRVQLGNDKLVDLQLLKELTWEDSQFRMVQCFNKHIFQGEGRFFILNGKILNACLKVPRAGSFLANTGQGAVLAPYQASPTLEAKINELAIFLLKQKVFLAGVDCIGENISEINITSPRLLAPTSDIRPYYQEMASVLLAL